MSHQNPDSNQKLYLPDKCRKENIQICQQQCIRLCRNQGMALSDVSNPKVAPTTFSCGSIWKKTASNTQNAATTLIFRVNDDILSARFKWLTIPLTCPSLIDVVFTCRCDDWCTVLLGSTNISPIEISKYEMDIKNASLRLVIFRVLLYTGE